MRIAKSTLSLLTAALLAGASTLALAQTCNPNIPLSKPDSRYSYNSSGNEVTDNVTSLIWKRCVEGMSWNGTTCSGSASAFNWEQALAHAATQTGWRMPNQKELQSLVETACDDMAINAKAFPATPSSAWSGSPNASYAGGAWGVFFGNGGGYWDYKNYTNSVRLVRGQ